MQMIGTVCLHFQEILVMTTEAAEILVFVHFPSQLSVIAFMGIDQNCQMIGESIAGQVAALEETIEPAKMERGLKESAT